MLVDDGDVKTVFDKTSSERSWYIYTACRTHNGASVKVKT